MNSSAKRQRTTLRNDRPSDLLAIQDIIKIYLEFLLLEAEEMEKLVIEKGGDDRLKHKVLASVFYEVWKSYCMDVGSSIM